MALVRVRSFSATGENLHEKEQHLIQQIAEQTERGKIGWELTEYNPLSFLYTQNMQYVKPSGQLLPNDFYYSENIVLHDFLIS